MSSLFLSPLRVLQRWLNWSWVVLVVCRGDDDDVAMLKLSNDLPLFVG